MAGERGSAGEHMAAVVRAGRWGGGRARVLSRGGWGGVGGSSPGTQLEQRCWCSRSCRPGLWAAPQSRAGHWWEGVALHPKLYRALQHVCVWGGVLHCTPSCTGHCRVWGGIALHPKLYRASQCVCGRLHCTPSCTGHCRGRECCIVPLNHAGKLCCTPGHAGHCLGGDGIALHPEWCRAPQRGQGYCIAAPLCRELVGAGSHRIPVHTGQ